MWIWVLSKFHSGLTYILLLSTGWTRCKVQKSNLWSLWWLQWTSSVQWIRCKWYSLTRKPLLRIYHGLAFIIPFNKICMWMCCRRCHVTIYVWKLVEDGWANRNMRGTDIRENTRLWRWGKMECYTTSWSITTTWRSRVLRAITHKVEFFGRSITTLKYHRFFWATVWGLKNDAWSCSFLNRIFAEMCSQVALSVAVRM